MHTDDSDVTFNICLGLDFQGAGLQFCGQAPILTVPRGYRSQEIGLFPFNPQVGDFDHGTIMRPVWFWQHARRRFGGGFCGTTLQEEY